MIWGFTSPSGSECLGCCTDQPSSGRERLQPAEIGLLITRSDGSIYECDVAPAEDIISAECICSMHPNILYMYNVYMYVNTDTKGYPQCWQRRGREISVLQSPIKSCVCPLQLCMYISSLQHHYVQLRAEVSGRTRVYHNQTGPGYPSALTGRDMPGVVGCAASQRCQAAQHPLHAD